MGITTMGVKLDDITRERIKAAATALDRPPYWLIKQAIMNCLEKLESGVSLQSVCGLPLTDADEPREIIEGTAPQPFREFAESIHPQSVLRAAIKTDDLPGTSMRLWATTGRSFIGRP